MKNKIAKLKDGRYALILNEWNWDENEYLKIYSDNSYKERLKERFLDLELDGEFKKIKYSFGPLPIKSNYHRVLMSVCEKDIEIVENFYD